MNLDETIERFTSNAEYERTHGSLQGCLEFRQLAEWLRDYKRLKEQEPTDEALHREREQAYMQGYEDASRRFRQEPQTGHWKRISMDKYSEHAKYWYICDRCGKKHLGNTDWCPNCGARMCEPQERSRTNEKNDL